MATTPTTSEPPMPPRPSSGPMLALAVAVLLAVAVPVQAGGGPENVFLVVNSESPASLAVANAFADLRGVPPINVLMLPWQAGTESISVADFRTGLLQPVLEAIDARKLAPQIDCVVYSTDFPWRVDFAAEMPADLAKQELHKFPSGSLTGMTMLFAAVRSGLGPVWLDPRSNRYFRPLDADGVPISTDAFHGWQQWGPDGAPVKENGNRYVLSTMLGVTAGRGNTVTEIVRGLERSAAADGTKPGGTIYFVTSDDVRTKTRSPAFPPIVRALEKLGVAARIVPGPLPKRCGDVAGLMTGSADFDWQESGSTIVPGAICENLTSFGGVFTPQAGQTPLSAFIRAGAAGSSGTVIEPYALQAKFPHAALHVHYARGATLAEAFYQSVQAPYQLLVVGDPLCRPWATIPRVDVALAADGREIGTDTPLTGRIDLAPASPDAVEHFTLFVDGVQFARCDPGGRIAFDTAMLTDGHHELRIVATERSSVGSQGRWVRPVRLANHGGMLGLRAEPARVPLAGTVRLSLEGDGLESVVVFAMGRVLGRTAGGGTTIEVPASLLGLGRVTLRAAGRFGAGPAGGVNADPVTIEVTE